MGAAAAVAGIGAVASIGGGLLASSSAKSAANTQASAADAASQRALQQYQQTRTDLGPYRDIGGAASLQLARILGLPGYTTGGTPSAPPASAAPAPAPTSGPNGPLPPGVTAVSAVPGLFGSSTPGFIGTDAHGNTIAAWDQSGHDLSNLFTGQSGWLDAQGNYVSGAGRGFAFPGVTSPSGNGAAAPAPAAPIGNPLQTQYGLSGLTFDPTQYGLSGTIFNPTQATLEQTPGYKFDLSQGLQSTQNANAAKGLGISGSALKGAASYATGLANNTLTTQQGIFNQNLANSQGVFQQNLHNVLDPLSSLTSLGENASVQSGTLGNTAVSNANALQVGGANARAAGAIGSANALSSGLSSLGSAPLNYMLYSQLLGSGGGGNIDTTSTF